MFVFGWKVDKSIRSTIYKSLFSCHYVSIILSLCLQDLQQTPRGGQKEGGGEEETGVRNQQAESRSLQKG